MLLCPVQVANDASTKTEAPPHGMCGTIKISPFSNLNIFKCKQTINNIRS